MKSFLYINGILQNENSLGKYLNKLANHNNGNIDKITESEKNYYKRNIVDLRNIYIHSAGKICTNGSEVNKLLNNIGRLLVTVANLEN